MLPLYLLRKSDIVKNKTKAICVIFALTTFSFFLFFGCSGKAQRQTAEQSELNFDMYLQHVGDIIAPVYYDVIIAQPLHRFVAYDISDELSFQISLIANNERERFTVRLINKNPSNDNWLDGYLFVKLVNSISGRKIDEDLVRRIIAVTNNERSIYVRGDWRLSLLLADSDRYHTDILYFHGLTYTGTKSIWRN